MSYIVYKHTSTVTGKSYIGYTKKTIEKRWNEHVFYALSDNPNVFRHHFQNAIKKHGIDAWIHEVICSNLETLDDACQAEIAMINEHKSLAPLGYNETFGGSGVKMSDEAKERHKIATREALNDPEVRKRYLEGIRRSHSTEEFKQRNREAQKIAQSNPVVADKKRTAMLKFVNSPNYKNPTARQVQQISPITNEIIATYESAKEAHKKTGVNYSKITEVARGLRPRAGKFIWRYIDNKEDKDFENERC